MCSRRSTRLGGPRASTSSTRSTTSSRALNATGPILARVGLVADTHVGEILPVLPEGVGAALSGCELILHAGDLTDLEVVRELERVAPVVAVQGDHDRWVGIDLPRQQVVEVAGRRIGLTHGDRGRVAEFPAMAASLATGRLRLGGFHRAIAARFTGVDCIVHGHLHLPLRAVVDGVPVVSPGAVLVPEGNLGYPGTPSGEAYLWLRRRLGADACRPSVAVLEIRSDGLSLRRIALDHPSVPTGGVR